MFERLGGLIKKNQKSNSDVYLSSQVCYEAEKIIKELVPLSTDKIKIVSFSNQTLKIASNDSALAHQIKTVESEIINQINKKIKIGPLRIVYSPRNES